MLQSFFDKLRPHFEEGGKLHAFHSVFEGMETFVLVPNTTAKVGVSIHDAIDSKRIMTFVIIALLPALFFGMYNIGYQTYMTPPAVVGASFWEMFAYGFLIMLPKIVVSYAVGLGIEFAVAQYKHEEINEGYLVTGLLIPMIVPIELPLWMLAVAVAFSVIFAKEIFGGTGMNFFNPALVARAFLFFSYSGNMTGDKIWIAKDTFFGLGNPNLTDAVTDGYSADASQHRISLSLRRLQIWSSDLCPDLSVKRALSRFSLAQSSYYGHALLLGGRC